jgi:hypothetical protein
MLKNAHPRFVSTAVYAALAQQNYTNQTESCVDMIESTGWKLQVAGTDVGIVKYQRN